MYMTVEDRENFEKATRCHICDKEFSKEDPGLKKVRDNDHQTGRFRGAAHSKCNMNFYSDRHLPVFFHNLRGYDGHMIIKKARDLGCDSINAIPNSFEKFMTITINHLKFVDSLNF